MLRSNKTTQFDGTSYITDGEGNEQTVAYFSATIRADKTATVSMTVSNAELYEKKQNHSQSGLYGVSDRGIYRPGCRIRRTYEIINCSKRDPRHK